MSEGIFLFGSSDLTLVSWLLIVIGAKVFSIVIYQISWHNGKIKKYPLGVASLGILTHWKLLPIHLFVMNWLYDKTWEDKNILKVYVFLLGTILAWGAIGRFGSLIREHYFITDRVFVLIFLVGVWFAPVFLYPLIVSTLALQYTVASSSLSPGYSNLLGFEFTRSSLSIALYSLVLSINDGIILVMLYQSAYYVQQACGKMALSPIPFEWVFRDRLECLWINSYLRGWLNHILSVKSALKIASLISRVRVLLLGSAWLIEFGWLFALLEIRLMIALYWLTIIFHSLVWILSGLMAYHFIINHIVMLWIIFKMKSADEGSLPLAVDFQYVVVSFALFMVLLVLYLRYRIYKNHFIRDHWERRRTYVDLLSEASDHLMSWWNSPYMRLYSYRVESANGDQMFFPVTRFSPYDTFLTDIHTHLMVLGHNGFIDESLQQDRTLMPTGVWGLTIERDHRDKLINWMKKDDHEVKTYFKQRNQSHPVDRVILEEFRQFFQSWNSLRSKNWFMKIMRWPHFPGEDLVPDISPLRTRDIPIQDTSDEIIKLYVDVTQTFYNGDGIILIDEKTVFEVKVKDDR